MFPPIRQLLKRNKNQDSSVWQTISIRLPHKESWQPHRAEHLAMALFTLPIPFRLKIKISEQRILWHIESPFGFNDIISSAIYSLYPEATLFTKVAEEGKGFQDYSFHARNPFIAPIKYAADFAKVDPMASMISPVTILKSDEIVVFELLCRPVNRKYYEYGRTLITQSLYGLLDYLTLSGTAEALTAKATGTDRVERFESPIQRLLNEKLHAPLKTVQLRLRIQAASPERGNKIARVFATALANFERQEFNGLIPMSRNSFPLVLSPQETAAIWHLPTEQCTAPGIQWSGDVKQPAANLATKEGDGIRLGINSYQGRQHVIHLPYKDRNNHVNLLGSTGEGKSTFMHQMIHQDIENGKSVGVIDPHGSLFNDILRYSIPQHRWEDVILFDVTDKKHAVGLNMLAVPPGDPGLLAVDQALSIMRKMFEDQWSQTRMETALHAAMMTLVPIDGSSILDVPTLFYNPEFRSQCLSENTDPEALKFWLHQYENVGEKLQSQIASPIQSRISKFARNLTLRRIICQPQCLDFDQILNRKSIFLVNLGGLPDIIAETLGALIISKFQVAAMSRTELNQSAINTFYLYIDEVQNFTTTSLSRLLSESRKYGLSLSIANQYLSQLSGDTLDAVMGNMGTTIMFRVGPADVTNLAPYVKSEFEKDDLTRLNPFHTVVKMRAYKKTLPSFSMSTFKPLHQVMNNEAQIEQIKALSRHKYARSIDEIDAEYKGNHVASHQLLASLGIAKEHGYFD